MTKNLSKIIRYLAETGQPYGSSTSKRLRNWNQSDQCTAVHCSGLVPSQVRQVEGQQTQDKPKELFHPGRGLGAYFQVSQFMQTEQTIQTTCTMYNAVNLDNNLPYGQFLQQSLSLSIRAVFVFIGM